MSSPLTPRSPYFYRIHYPTPVIRHPDPKSGYNQTGGLDVRIETRYDRGGQGTHTGGSMVEDPHLHRSPTGSG